MTLLMREAYDLPIEGPVRKGPALREEPFNQKQILRHDTAFL